MTLIANIEKITTWYKSLKRDFAGVNDLMYARQQLSGLLADVAIQIASLVEQRTAPSSDDFFPTEEPKAPIESDPLPF